MSAASLTDGLLTLMMLPLAVVCGYLLVLALMARRLPTPSGEVPPLRFAMLVPAHNEAVGIGATVASLLAVDYPAPLRRVVVIADNCSDETAALARAAGAEVLERHDADKRGKGYALEYAFAQLADIDAVIVVDADTLVTSNILIAFARRFAAGAHALQAEYGVRNPDASWRTRLIVVALGIFHVLRSLARERMGVSCGLRGNGMGFSAEALRRVPHNAYSLVEDLEYGIRLADAGYRVEFVHEARVLGEMVSGEKASVSQRRRWEQGRALMLKQHLRPLFARAFRERSKLYLDMAFDVLVPPLATVAVGCVLALVVAFTWAAHLGVFTVSLGVATACAASVAIYVLRGVALSGAGWGGYAALAAAPFYVLWKLSLLVRRDKNKKREWVRTSREGNGR